MFFTLSKTVDPRFPYSEQLANWILNHDPGWHVDAHGNWYKGYQHRRVDYGCWTRIDHRNEIIDISSASQRGYPLWWDAETQTLSNFESKGQQIWADCRTMIQDNNLVTSKSGFGCDLNDEKISLDTAVNLICENLREKSKALFDDIYVPKKIFPTGGLDSTTVLALVSGYLDDIELLDYEHFEYDFFTNRNIKYLRQNHWAYRQIHHWRKPCVLLSGASGDPTMMRHPMMAAIWCAWHDIDLVAILAHQSGYNSDNLLQHKETISKYWDQRPSLQKKFQTYQDLVAHLLDISINDYQHWHLGNTLTWTPFMDTKLTKIILSMDSTDILAQIIDGHVNKSLIQKLDPELLNLISDRKNCSERYNLDQIVDLMISRRQRKKQ